MSYRYTNCGSNTSCRTITIQNQNGIATQHVTSGILLYPNPVSEMLIIDKVIPGSVIEVINLPFVKQ